MASDHECSACGGTGRNECGKPLADCWHKSHFCLACHGSGRISDVMPVSDALADAETIRPFGGQPKGRAFSFGWVEKPLHAASRLGKIAASYMLTTFESPGDASYFAREAARAAFRAVPGLRG